MISNKIKLFLLLTFGFVFLFAQNSSAGLIDSINNAIQNALARVSVLSKAFTYPDTGSNDNIFSNYKNTGKNCASFQYGNFIQFNGLQATETCIFSTSDLPTWDKYSVIGLKINEIKIPYSAAAGSSGLWEVIKNTTTSQNEWGTSDCDHGFGSYFDGRAHISSGDLVSFLTVPKTYDNVKTAIIRSCLPGKITTSTQYSNNVAECGDHACHKGWGGWKECGVTWRNMTFSSNNFQSWGFAGCGLNDEGSMYLATDANLNSNNNRYEVGNEGTFKLTWGLSNPSASCTLSGKNATDPSQTFERKINAGDVTIAAHSGVITPKSDSFTFNYAKEGIYTYTLSCAGVLDGKISPTRGVISKTLTIYVGNIPPSPVIKTFEVVPSEDLTTPDAAFTSAADYQISITKPIQLKWNISYADSSANARPVKIWRQKGIDKRVLISTNTTNNLDSPQTLKFAAEDTTGIYTFWLEVIGEKYPELTTESQKIRIRALGIGKADVPEGTFSADKTEIERDGSAILTWNISGSSDISIDHEIGKVQPSGNITVSPIVTTTYTLTAKNPVTGNPDTKKTVTITVKIPTITVPELKEFTPPGEVQIGEQEGAPETQKTVDLKVNKIDGPITLKAPATFTLSWNLDTYCLATGSWLSIKTKAGSETITLNKNGKFTYSLYCPGGYGSDSVEVNIVNSEVGGLLNSALGNSTQTTNMPVAEVSASTDLVNYSQNINVIKGQETTIYIKVDKDINNDGQISHDASGFWSDLMTNGGYCLFNDRLSKDTPQFTGMVESPENPSSCNVRLGTFTFNDEPGTYQYGIFRLLQNDQKFSNIAYINITVENPPAATTGPIVDFKINGSDASEQALGTPANYNLTWNVANATNCEASGSWSGPRDLSGLQSFVSSSKKDFIYTLTCVGDLGTTTKSIALKVVESPVCTFTALPPSINKSSAFITDSELSWKCDYADSCDLSPNISDSIKTYGTLRVSPDQTTNYILNCSNSSVSKSFETQVEVIK